MRMQIIVNGRAREIPERAQLMDLLDELGLDRRYLVVEHNGVPLGRDRFDGLILMDGDRLELVRPVAGG
jgi:thiamine biosynthesis protein ThiS